jgi:hypothetical protein
VIVFIFNRNFKRLRCPRDGPDEPGSPPQVGIHHVSVGVAELPVWPGGFHGFADMVPRAALSQAAVAAQLGWLRRLLSS